MQIERKTIETSLSSKGFIKEEKHHTYFYHEYQGKRTGTYTYTSRGSGYKSYGNNLLSMMKKQLKLDSLKQVIDLAECPMKQEDYNQILIEKKIINPSEVLR